MPELSISIENYFIKEINKFEYYDVTAYLQVSMKNLVEL